MTRAPRWTCSIVRGTYLRRTVTLLLGLQSLAGGLRAQDGHGPDGPPPERLGQVNFPDDCRPAVHARFERAVALLHSFWYEEAARTFGAVGQADSTCALAEWGMAMSTLHPLWTPPTLEQHRAARAHAERAVSLSRPGTRPRDYAEAIAAYYRGDGVADRTRLAVYERAMAGVARRWPADEEARIFHALALIALGQLDAGDTTYARQREAARVLEPLFRRHPDHPGLAHYLIHAYDSPALAQVGVRAADRYAAIAPSVPHAQHMPSHIYTRVGAWDKAIASNLRSENAARRFEASRLTGALWDQDAHALDYLEYAYLQLGRAAQAREIVDRVAQAQTTFPPSSLITDYALAAIPARLALERDDWQAATVLRIRSAAAWRGTEGITHFARALGAARLGNLVAARAEVDTLGALEKSLAAIGGVQAYWSTQVRVQRLAAGGWVDLVAGDTAAALRGASMAADLEDGLEKHPVTPGPVLPARELYGDLLAAVGRPAEAITAYQRTLARQPGRARAAAALARVKQAVARDR